MSEVNINLSDFRTGNVHVFSGRPRGEAVRQKLNLDSLDSKDVIIKVIVPEDVYSVNASFFLGLLGESVRHCGTKGRFLEKFKFQCSAEVLHDVEDGIDRAFRDQSVLQLRA